MLPTKLWSYFVGPLELCSFCLDSLKGSSARDSTRYWKDLHFYLRQNLQTLRWIVASIKLHKKWWSPSKILFYITRIHINPNHPVVLLANKFEPMCPSKLGGKSPNLSEITFPFFSQQKPILLTLFSACFCHCSLGQVTARRSLMKVRSCWFFR